MTDLVATLTALTVCPEDHAPVVRRPGPGRPPRFCSRRCQQKANARAWAAAHRGAAAPAREPVVPRTVPPPAAALALALAVYDRALKDADGAWLADPAAQHPWRPILAALRAATDPGGA